MIEILLNNNIREVLGEFYVNHVRANRKKYNLVEEETKLLITLFCDDSRESNKKIKNSFVFESNSSLS